MTSDQLIKQINKGAKSANKYNAVKTHYKGRTYHSRAESIRAKELDFLIDAKQIITWSPQFIVRLTDNVEWKVDFLVIGLDHKNLLFPYLEEVKGRITADYKIKLDLYREFGRLQLHIKMRKNNRWYTEVVMPDKLR